MADLADQTRKILNRCRELGFAGAGVCAVQPSDHADMYRRWISDGRHGEMEYMARNADLRIDPAVMVPGARSILCVSDWYGPACSEADQPSENSARRGRIARYARGGDYHKVMKKRLHVLCDEFRERFPGETFRACVDTAPVLEREHAQRAGLGAVGKNTLLLQRGIGSWMLLGEIITTLDLEALPGPGVPDPCSSCTRCIDACPTGAITPWSVDATRCISYLTIEHRSEIAPEFHEAIGDWLFGCDICQEVCPHNQHTSGNGVNDPHTAYQPQQDSFDLLTVLDWSEEDRREALRGSAIRRAKLDMLRRNALIVAGNALRKRPDETIRMRIAHVSNDSNEPALVRNTAQEVLRGISTPFSQMGP